MPTSDPLFFFESEALQTCPPPAHETRDIVRVLDESRRCWIKRGRRGGWEEVPPADFDRLKKDAKPPEITRPVAIRETMAVQFEPPAVGNFVTAKCLPGTRRIWARYEPDGEWVEIDDAERCRIRAAEESMFAVAAR
jgi:hypothetical protein